MPSSVFSLCLTQRGEPTGDGAVDFIQDDDDDEVDDGGGGLDGGSDVGPRCRVAAYVQRRLDADPVQDDSEDDGERHGDLRARTVGDHPTETTETQVGAASSVLVTHVGHTTYS